MDEFDYVAKEQGEKEDEGSATDAAESAKKLLQDSATVSGGLASGIAEAIGRAQKPGDNNQSQGDRSTLKELLNNSVEKMRISPEAFLSKTERLLLNNLDNAIHKGDLEGVQESLAAIAENPKSVKAIMASIKERMERANPQNGVKWETGTDSNGQSFVRLHITNYESTNGKFSNYTNVMIGSDGTHAASFTRTWDSSNPRQIDPAAALRDVTAPRWRQLRPALDELIIPNTTYKKLTTGERSKK